MKFSFNSLSIAFITLLQTLQTNAQSMNWATDIAPILYEHCVGCHRDGGIGHFSLLGYDNAITRRDEIAAATIARKMPPWKADPNYRQFAHENRLTDTEIQKIQAWVNANAPAGDLNLAPAEPVFTEESSIGTPDNVLETPLYTMTAAQDEYRCFVIPSNVSAVEYLRGIEIIPSNHEAIHHVLIYEDTTGQAQALDAQTPEIGYVSFGSSGVQGARLLGGWAPGARIKLSPPNMGFKLNPNADLVVQIHYPAGTAGIMSSAKLNLFYTPTNVGIRSLYSAPILNHSPFSLENFPLQIPANTVKTYHAKYTTMQKGSFLTVAPHMHLIGQSMTVFATLPNGDTLKLIRINDWDFHWQGSYTFQKVQVLPAGTTLHAFAQYDNTSNNEQNPSNPPQNVTYGEATTDEMLVVYFTFMGFQTGDENLVLDSTLLSSNLPFIPENEAFSQLKINPNPAHKQIEISYKVLNKTDLEINLTDINGRVFRFLGLKKDINPGIYREILSIGDLPDGLYFLQIKGKNGIISQKFVKY
jgi:mono/diheme cytochrome c family protein